jgi:hypothetical protein
MGLGGVDTILVAHLSVCQFWQETGLSSSLLGASLEAPRAPGGLVGTIAQAHNIELVLYQP